MEQTNNQRKKYERKKCIRNSRLFGHPTSFVSHLVLVHRCQNSLTHFFSGCHLDMYFSVHTFLLAWFSATKYAFFILESIIHKSVLYVLGKTYCMNTISIEKERTTNPHPQSLRSDRIEKRNQKCIFTDFHTKCD